MTRELYKNLQLNACVILFFCTIWTAFHCVPCQAQQFDLDAALIDAANKSMTNQSTPHHEMLILDNIKRLGELRKNNRISHESYSRARFVYEDHNYAAAKRVAARFGLDVSYQRMRNESAAGWEAKSDIDLQVSRKPGSPPITDQQMRIIEAQYRQELRNISDRKAREAGVRRDYQPDTSGITDLMIDPDATTDAEWNKFVQRQQKDGALVYSRRSAARVEHQIRGGKSVDPQDGWQYIQEMIEMRDKVSTGTEKAKYTQRINDVLNRMQQDHGLELKGMTPGPDPKVTARDAYLRTLADIVKKNPAMRQRIGHLIALQLHDLPKGQRNAALKNLNLGEFNTDVEKNIDDFNALKKRFDRSQISRLRSILQQTSTGRYLLAQWDYDLNALEKSDRALMEFFQKGGVFDNAPDAVFKSLQTAAMLVEILNKLQRAQSDAEMVKEIAGTVVQFTTAGMIAGYVQLGLQGDPEALLWALALYICPKAAIPSLVKSIGLAVGDMSASTVFEAQFQHLYEHAKFNDHGQLIQVLDYGGPNPACAFVSDIREPGAFRLLTDKLTFAGANALLTAIEGTIHGGAPLVMTDNASLHGACAEVKRINGLIDDVHKVENATPRITRDAGPGEDVSYLSLGGQQAVKELLRLRSDAQQRVLSILCDSIKADLESRYKAEQALGEDGQQQIDELYAKIEELFRQLDIYDQGISQLRYDAGLDANWVDWLRSTSRKERNIKIMQTLQRYHDAYSQVLRLRTAAETLFAQHAGGASPNSRIVTGFLPLTADPDYDPSLAAKFLQELTEALQYGLQALLSIKKEALCDGSVLLDTDFDRSTSRRFDLESLGLLQAWQILESANHVSQRENWYQLLQKAEIEMQRFQAYGAADAHIEARDAALEEFRAYYATKGPSMDIVPPAEVAAGRGGVNRPYLFTLALEHVPDHAEFSWFEDAKLLGSGPVLEHAFDTEGTRVMRARASWKKRPGNWCDGDLTSELGVDIPSSPAASPELRIVLPAPLGSGPGRTGEPYAFGLETANIPQDAEYVWRVDMEQAGVGQSLRKQFDQPGQYMLAVHAQWRVKAAQGVMDQASGRAAFVIEEAGETPSPGESPSSGDQGDPADPADQGDPADPADPGTRDEDAPSSDSGRKDAPAQHEGPGEAERQTQQNDELRGGGETAENQLAEPVQTVDPSTPPSEPAQSAGERNAGTVIYGSTLTLNFGESPQTSSGAETNRDFDELSKKAAEKYRDELNRQKLPSAIDISEAERLEEERSRELDRAISESVRESMGAPGDDATIREPDLPPDAETDRETAIPEPSQPLPAEELHVGPAAPAARPGTDAAKVSAGDAQKRYRYVFQASPNLTFSPPESSDGSTSVVVDRLEELRIWAEIHDLSNPQAATRRSVTYVYNVTPPAFQVTCDQPPALVGQEARVRVTSAPALPEALVDYVWLEPTVNMKYSGNGSEIGFAMRSPDPTTVKVHARVPFYGTALGTASQTCEPALYTVAVSNPVRLGPAPRVWSEAARGLVEVPGAIATFQNVEVKASVTPPPPSGELRYRWQVSPDGCSISAPSSSTTRLNASRVGQYTVTVTVTDQNGVELGSGSGSFAVTKSQAEIDEGLARQQTMEQVRQLITEAKEQWARDEKEQAVSTINKALSLAPGHNEARAILGGWQGILGQERKRYDELIRQGFSSESSGRTEQAIELYRQSQEIFSDSKVAAHIAELEKRLLLQKAAEKRVAELLQQGHEQEKKGNLEEAVERYQESLQINDDNVVKGRIEELKRQIRERREKEQTKQRFAELLKDGYERERSGDLKGALSRYREAKLISPDMELAKRIKLLEDKLHAETAKNRAAAEQGEKQFATLLKQAYGKEQAGDLNGAIKDYKSALAIRNDNKVLQRVNQLQQALEMKADKRSTAMTPRNETAERERSPEPDPPSRKPSAPWSGTFEARDATEDGHTETFLTLRLVQRGNDLAGEMVLKIFTQGSIYSNETVSVSGSCRDAQAAVLVEGDSLNLMLSSDGNSISTTDGTRFKRVR